MSKLRERLRVEAPELCAALERSWEIARNEWLPALGVKNDSYNSYPHIKNLENYLDQVILGFEESKSESKKFITSTEIYVILCAILFHDIGMINVADKNKKAKKKAHQIKPNHAINSRDIVENQWNDLGIISVELARSISKICAYHDCEDSTWDEQTKELNNVVIDPFGEIRERYLGCLLILVDHMDGAFTRVLPQYIRAERSIKVIGAFRNVIRGVYVDPERQLIRTVLGDKLSENNTNGKPSFRYFINRKVAHLYSDIVGRFPPSDPIDGYSKKEVLEHIKGLSITPFDCELRRSLNAQPFKKIDRLILKQILFLELEYLDDEWTAIKLLAMIMGDFVQNRKAFNNIIDQLAENGIYIKSWLIDHHEHLYTDEGKETHEPIFSKDYLIRVVESMWKLSTTIFNAGNYSYEMLAADIREPKIEYVKIAVRRISIIAPIKDSIWAADNYWKWRVIDEQFVDKELVIQNIKKITDPF